MSAETRGDALRPRAAPGSEPQVRAAGGLVVREAPGGGLEVAVIHRPRYEDWSLPKGKLDPGEAWEQAALREVCEETGFRCRLGEELAPARYRDRDGREKLVRFWLMHAHEGSFEPGDEVDELRWLTPEEAIALLHYGHDRRLVAGLPAAGGREPSAR